MATYPGHLCRLESTDRSKVPFARWTHDKMPIVGAEQESSQKPVEPPLDTLRELVASAFEAAKKSGRTGWEVMTTGVLKNRILQATAREFDERDYGVISFTAAIRLIPDVVELDETTHPLRVRLLAPSAPKVVEPAEGENEPAVPTARMRADLWAAALDYTWGGAYVWDGSSAVRVELDEVGEQPRLPTISSDDMAAWRQDFANLHPDRQLEDWVQRGRATLALPPDLRLPWNLLVKSKAIALLSDWFENQGLKLPPDMFASSTNKRMLADHAEAEELRRFLLRCVAVMKPSELKAVQIPASVAFRARA